VVEVIWKVEIARHEKTSQNPKSAEHKLLRCKKNMPMAKDLSRRRLEVKMEREEILTTSFKGFISYSS